MRQELPERVYARRLTPDEVVRISRHEKITHLRDDAVVRSIRHAIPNYEAEHLFARARENGYLVLPASPHMLEPNRGLLVAWGWWCFAARCPEAVVDLRRRNDSVGPCVRIDLSPTGREFAPVAMVPIGRICAAEQAAGQANARDVSWIATGDVVEVDAPDIDSATAIVRTLLDLARDERWLMQS